MQLWHARVRGPLTADVDADWVFNPSTSTAYIESAQACGLHLLGGPPTADTAWNAHSRGVGQLIGAALESGARTIVVGLGGSGCTDGGRGMVEALGGVGDAARRLAGVELVAATDVETSAAGPERSSGGLRPTEGRRPGDRRPARGPAVAVGRRTRGGDGRVWSADRRGLEPPAAWGRPCWLSAGAASPAPR